MHDLKLVAVGFLAGACACAVAVDMLLAGALTDMLFDWIFPRGEK